jgi:diaminopimelate decarboxylase
LRYALEQGVGWFNVENVLECRLLNDLAAELGCPPVRVAPRFNPDVTANTHPYIATGHGGAKFGLTAEVIEHLLAFQSEYPRLRFEGIHVHIGSQLHDTNATVRAVQAALDLIAPYPHILTVNIGGGFPVAYQPGEGVPSYKDFARVVTPLLTGFHVLLEPGRSIIADAGILVVRVLYVKEQAGQTFVITDGSMAELIRPALYEAYHEIVPVVSPPLHAMERGPGGEVNVVGPVCESADVLGRDVLLPDVQPGDLLAILTTGAYGMAMASNYNARPRPAEVVVSEDGQRWQVARRRETWEDLARFEESR